MRHSSYSRGHAAPVHLGDVGGGGSRKATGLQSNAIPLPRSRLACAIAALPRAPLVSGREGLPRIAEQEILAFGDGGIGETPPVRVQAFQKAWIAQKSRKTLIRQRQAVRQSRVVQCMARGSRY